MGAVFLPEDSEIKSRRKLRATLTVLTLNRSYLSYQLLPVSGYVGKCIDKEIKVGWWCVRAVRYKLFHMGEFCHFDIRKYITEFRTYSYY